MRFNSKIVSKENSSDASPGKVACAKLREVEDSNKTTQDPNYPNAKLSDNHDEM